MIEYIETIIVGGGQAGLAASYSLHQNGHESLILEQADRPASAWSRGRWDSFTLVTPNWTVHLPGGDYDGRQPDGFMNRQELLAYFKSYVQRSRPAIRLGVQVNSVEAENHGYLVRADGADWQADNVIIATGLFQQPKVLSFATSLTPHISQLSSGDYRNPQALPPGAVLVVGSGQSGVQIADELYHAGRKVYLSTGTTGRAPRRYRGKDAVEWMILTGYMSRTAEMLPSPQARFAGAPQLTGKDGGRSLNLHQFSRDGVTLLGHLRGFSENQLLVAPDLKENLAKCDQAEINLLKMIDGYITKQGLQVPEESVAILRDGYNAPELEALDLQAAGISTIIWAMGYRFDYSLVKLPVLDADGFPITRRCATHFPGLYFLGLPWLTSMKSGFLLGVGEDAALIAEQIASS
jgi:putative flavoprotein involved in K+ transport